MGSKIYAGAFLILRKYRPAVRLLLLVLLLGAVVSGTSASALASSSGAETAETPAGESGDGAVAETEEMSLTAPHAKEGGGKYRLAYLDYDEYMPASRQLYYILKGLEELGWIEEGKIPFDLEQIESESMSTKQMYELLIDADLGPYLEFAEDAFFYLGYEESEEIAPVLTERAGEDIDLIITFGTSAGVFVKSLSLPIPMVDFSATDPVASGIIDSSTEGSGDPNVWAQVEPSLPLRQLKYYYSIKPFDRLGIIVYGDETISGVPDIEASAKECGFELVKYNIDEQPRETIRERADYYAMVKKEIRKMSEEGIDAFFLTIDLINDLNRLPSLLDLLYQKNIPVYLMDDVEAVKHGGMMLISANDLENVGRFVADAVAKILNGEVAGDLPCIYTSAPSIYFNYNVAQRIHYPLQFEFLAACDEIYTEDLFNA